MSQCRKAVRKATMLSRANHHRQHRSKPDTPDKPQPWLDIPTRPQTWYLEYLLTAEGLTDDQQEWLQARAHTFNRVQANAAISVLEGLRRRQAV